MKGSRKGAEAQRVFQIRRRCPFCYAPISELRVECQAWSKNQKFKDYHVYCTFCESTGPRERREALAILAWNERGTMARWTKPIKVSRYQKELRAFAPLREEKLGGIR